ncbi:MAG: BCCT family transporter [Bacteroidota bacterium]
MSRLRLWVFLPPFLVLLAACVYSLADKVSFLENVRFLNDWILQHFAWLYSYATFAFVLICVAVYFSPLAKIRIGGAAAKPLLSRWRWFSITLTTTVAIGILFWGTAEPLYHLHAPPEDMGIAPNTPEAAIFAMSTMLMHWTITPYAIYTIAGLMFALTYYNLKQPFSLGAMLYPLFGEKAHGRFGKTVDAICLYSLAAGMAASLGAGILTIGGGMESLFGIKKTPLLLGIVTIAIVGCFIISAASGLLKGIRILANWNIRAFLGLCIFVAIFGPTAYMLEIGGAGAADYLTHFFSRSLHTLDIKDTTWLNDWTIFYWANWLAWTPVTALFLGRLSYGYRVRDYIHFNLILPAIFGGLWMIVFSGTALQMDIAASGTPLYDELQAKGAESIIYEVLDRLPGATFMSVVFLLISFLSYITAADSNTSAMSGISSSGISPQSPEPAFSIKLIWGVTIGAIAWVMVTFAGLDGIKMSSNLGGFPALFLVIVVAVGMLKLIFKSEELRK